MEISVVSVRLNPSVFRGRLLFEESGSMLNGDCRCIYDWSIVFKAQRLEERTIG